MDRLPGWEERIAAVVEGWSTRGYDFATANCLLFARDIIIAVRGGEPLDALGVTIDEVRTPFGAARLLAKYKTPDAIITAVLGSPVATLSARRGDLAAVPGVNDTSIGLVDGGVLQLLSHDGGITWRPLRDATHVWSVG